MLRDSAQSPAPALNVLEGGLRWTVTDIAAIVRGGRVRGKLSADGVLGGLGSFSITWNVGLTARTSVNAHV